MPEKIASVDSFIRLFVYSFDIEFRVEGQKSKVKGRGFVERLMR